VQPPRDTGAAARRFRDFRPPPLGLGARTDEVSTESMRLGSAWHAVLQRLSGPSTGAVAPAAADLARAFGLTPDQANAAIAAAQRVLAEPALQRFYSPAARADNELELVDADGASLRIDRLVEFDDALWVLDYKWTLGPEIDAVAAHGLQMRRYARALRDAGMRKPIRLLLVGADAGTVELEAERGG
jgi:ATP-dependent helicase/nuclease subunit A